MLWKVTHTGTSSASRTAGAVQRYKSTQQHFSVKGKGTPLDQTAPSGRSTTESPLPCNDISSPTLPGIGVGGGKATHPRMGATARPRISESEEMNSEHGDRRAAAEWLTTRPRTSESEEMNWLTNDNWKSSVEQYG